MTAQYRAEEIPGPGSWVEDAACAKAGPADHAWFPGPGKRGERAKKVAAAVCASCPVLAQCAAYIEAYPQAGTWAGRCEKDRKQLRRRAA